MAIYTKRGDRGQTGLYDPLNAQTIRVSKDSQVIRTIGALDEAVSYLGVCLNASADKKMNSLLTEVQKHLFTINAILAGAELGFERTAVKKLEQLLDKLEGKLPILANFILPSGTPLAVHLQYVRTIVRRAERELVTLAGQQKVAPEILAYINRLSDTLFMLARADNVANNHTETIWKTPRK